MRERIGQLQDGPRAEEEGPAPPPPFVSWTPLRRFLRLEDLEQRDQRLRQRATEASPISSSHTCICMYINL